MEKKALAIELQFTEGELRAAMCVAMLSLGLSEQITDEFIQKNFVNREPVKIDVSEIAGRDEAVNICAGFMASVISVDEELQKTLGLKK